jgi:hypothetical protein
MRRPAAVLRGAPLAILDGARRPPYGKHFVAAPSVNMKVVNRRALDLFPVTIMLKKRFTAAQKKSAATSM